MTPIATPRLRLRAAHPDDAEPLHAILGDPTAMLYWSTLPHETLAQTREWLAAMIAIEPREGEDFIVEHQGAVIGKAGLYRFPEIGFILRRDHWRQGLAGEALRPILDRAFAVHRLPRVIADVDPRNAASLRLLTRLGFRETSRRARTLRIGDLWCDSVDLTLLADDWRGTRPPLPIASVP